MDARRGSTCSSTRSAAARSRRPSPPYLFTPRSGDVSGLDGKGFFIEPRVTDHGADKTQIWATWQAGKPSFGDGPSTVYVALAGDPQP